VFLKGEEVERFALYADLLQRWGRKINLTSRIKTEEIIIYHFLDSLAAFGTIEGGPGRQLVDIGSGAGFPSLPLKICMPDLRVCLVEGSRKKVSFCREVVRHLGLRGVEVLQERGERIGGLPAYEDSFDWSVVRAVGRARDVLRICLPLLRPGGSAILFKGALEGEELRSLENEVDYRGASLRLLPVDLPYLQAPRVLAIVKKCST
jgi:16S rRNA (guanine527-N7)-methyltransferase